MLALPVRELISLVDQPAVSSLLANLWTFEWVLFVSPGAVDAAWPRLPDPWPPGTGIATIGPGTELALSAHGFDPSVLPSPLVRPRQAPFDAAALMREPPFDRPAGLQVLVVRGEGGRDDWIDSLRQAGAAVEVVVVHRSRELPIDALELTMAADWLRASLIDPVVFVFTSQDAIEALDKALPVSGREQARALTVHPRLAAALHKCGWAHAREVEPGEAGLIAGIESRYRP